LIGLGGYFPAPALSLDTRRRALLAGGDPKPLDPPRVGVEHFHLEIARTGNDLATHGQAADVTDEIAAQRLDFLAGLAGHEILADHRADVFEAGARVGDEGVVGLPYDCRRLVAVMLVIDVAHDLLDQVLDRNEAVGPAIFIHDQREMDA
jgi:hypothetical protein